jgi:hypothetical protein
MRQEVATAALPRESEGCHGSSLGSDSCGVGEIQNLGGLGAAILTASLLHQLQEAKPLAGEGEVAGVAAYWNREIHASLVYYFSGFRFFESNK